MAKDNQVLVRINDPQNEALENFAEDRDYNKAEAARKILESRLTSEGYLSQELYGGEPRPDGGKLEERIEETEQKVNGRIETTEETINTRIEATQQQVSRSIRNLTVGLIVGFLWIGFDAVGNPSTTVTILTGVPIILWLVWLVYTEFQRGETDA